MNADATTLNCQIAHLTCCAKQRQSYTHSLANSHARRSTSLLRSLFSIFNRAHVCLQCVHTFIVSLRLHSFFPSSLASLLLPPSTSSEHRGRWQACRDGQHLRYSMDGLRKTTRCEANVKMDGLANYQPCSLPWTWLLFAASPLISLVCPGHILRRRSTVEGRMELGAGKL